MTSNTSTAVHAVFQLRGSEEEEAVLRRARLFGTEVRAPARRVLATLPNCLAQLQHTAKMRGASPQNRRRMFVC